jgi:hypothetical protein
MPFQVSWIDPQAPGRELLAVPSEEQRVTLQAALIRACELLVAGKAMVTVTRPDGTQLDERQIRDHCSGRREIIA